MQQTNSIDITDRNVTFFNNQFQATSIFQRHNFQIYRVHQATSDKQFYLRSINSMSDAESIQLIEQM